MNRERRVASITVATREFQCIVGGLFTNLFMPMLYFTSASAMKSRSFWPALFMPSNTSANASRPAGIRAVRHRTTVGGVEANEVHFLVHVGSKSLKYRSKRQASNTNSGPCQKRTRPLQISVPARPTSWRSTTRTRCPVYQITCRGKTGAGSRTKTSSVEEVEVAFTDAFGCIEQPLQARMFNHRC